MKKFWVRTLCVLVALGSIMPNLMYAEGIQVPAAFAADYSFNEDFSSVTADTYTIKDGTSNHNDASTHGGVVWDAEGKAGGSAMLNGTDGYIELPNHVTDTTDFTFAAWVKWDGTGTGWTRIFDFGGSGGFMYLTPKGAGDKLYFSIYEGTDQTLTGGAFPVNEWTHVAVTIEGDVGKLYVNGELQATNTAMTYDPSALAADGNWLGKSRFPDSNFSGNIDQVHIDGRAWSKEEIVASLIQHPLAPAEAKLPKMDLSVVQDENKWTTNNTHDPELIKAGDMYYAFSTDFLYTGADNKYYPGGAVKPGIQIRKSADLVHWQFVGRVFDSVTEEARDWSGNDIFWAPEVVQMNGKFYLYYATSGFGTRNSYIGLATSDSIEGPWTDQGAVFTTRSSDDQAVNAIDPNIVFDADGEPWMAYGSFFGGIYITKIDKATGKLANPGDRGTLIAKRQGDTGIPGPGIEAPNIIYNPKTKYFYLAVSYESLGDTYNVRIARSANVEGPYLDYNGHDMIDTTGSKETGTKIINSYAFEEDAGWVGTGHEAWLQDGDNTYIAHNARVGEDPLWSELYIRKVLWTDDGWPVASPERFAGEQEQSIYKAMIPGEWEQIVLDRNDDGKRQSSVITLLDNGKIGTSTSDDFWELTGKNTLTLHWKADAAPGGYWIDTLKVAPAWDWVKWTPTLIFTGLNQSGTAIWGKQLGELSDEGSVASAKTNLNIGDVTAVDRNLDLPAAGVRNTHISWDSSRPDVIAIDGTVNQPPYGSESIPVVLTATIAKGNASTTAVFQATVVPKPHEMIAQYTFNNSSNLLADSSTNHADPVAEGGVTYDTYAVSGGGAARLNGTDGYIKADNNVTDTKDFTFMAWVNWGGGGDWQRIFDFGGTGGFMFLTPSKGGEKKLYFTIYKGTDQTLMSDAPLPIDTWTHVAVTIEGHTGTLYVNGKAAAENTNMTINPDDLLADSNFIGKSRFPDPYLNGLLDDVEMFRRALSPEEIAYHMNHPELPPVINGADSDDDSSGGDADGSSSGRSGASSGGSASDHQHIVVGESSMHRAADGSMSVRLDKETRKVTIPAAALEAIQGSSLELEKDEFSISLSQFLLDALLKQYSGAEKKDVKIAITMNPVETGAEELLQKAKKLSNANVTAAGEMYEFSLQLETGSGNTVTVSQFDQGLTLKLKASGGGNRNLQNIYYISGDGTLEYVPSTYEDGYFKAELKHFSKYAVLEYSKSFEDVPSSHWASQTIQTMAAKQIAQGISDSSFGPDDQVTRAQFAAFLARTLGLKAKGVVSYADVASGQWYSDPIAALTEAGIIEGREDRRFDPAANITREEAAVMVIRAWESQKGAIPSGDSTVSFSDSGEISEWAAASVAAAAKQGLLQGRGSGEFAPGANITRAESVQMLFNFLSKQ